MRSKQVSKTTIQSRQYLNLIGTALKSAFLWGRICSKPTSNLFALRPKDSHEFVLCKRREQFLRLAPTSKKDAHHSCLSWRQECTTTTAKAYKVGRIFFQCGSKSQKLLTSLVKNKVVRVLRPQSEQIACEFGTNPLPQQLSFINLYISYKVNKTSICRYYK